MGEVSGRRTKILYKAELGRTTLRIKEKSDATRTPYIKFGGCEMKVIALARGALPEMLLIRGRKILTGVTHIER